MLSKELKNLVSQFGTIVVIENDVPRFVVMTYDKFDAALSATGSHAQRDRVIHKNIDNSGDIAQDSNETLSVSNSHAQRDEEMADRLNKEILALKEQVAEKEREIGSL